MIGGPVRVEDTDEENEGVAPPRSVEEERSSVVLDNSDKAIPDEWGLKEAYNDDDSVVNH